MADEKTGNKTIVPNKHPMPAQDAVVRAKNFNEVALGYNEETVVAEARRCLQCKKEPCRQGCPVEVDIPAFIKLAAERDFAGAIMKLKEKNALPAVCGRVCPQENQCEKYCTVGKKNEPVGIGRIERFCADWELANGVLPQKVAPPTGKKVAIVGSGPSGLTCAADLAKQGHAVTIFEALHVAGGVLMYGIPEFRLPKAVVQAEVQNLKKLGVDIQVNAVVGKFATVDELMEEGGFDAVFLGTGAGLPYFMNIPGENACGVYSANEFLTRTNLMKAYLFPGNDTPIRVGKKVAVLGGGNVAMDAARTALRLGAEESWIVYRRSKNELPARHEEAEHAEEEGVKFAFLTSPTKIIYDDNYWVTGMECLRYELGEPDASGRRSPVPVKGSEFIIDVETVVVAIGQGPNPLVPKTTKGLDCNKKGNIVANLETGATSKPGVYAGGDVVTGAATVILAMGAGRAAARSIHAYLSEK
ncbi:MAG: Glutamate synthase (NADPH) small chain [Pelotomaculum sp. PtaB.Bin013]|uniref:NADPH-dependent glutamate synthase n=1 Tax=Pelotomaculum isophthalicicum JI TaxID=947010 RepID=A0A9X4JVH9_9FIRM|nr:NADPH-dependent glutamate synthase [Pelotomaculum isophthalicicum]MDF9407477.1 NADPH-dependent glutamate synthase [Pelotomaculum isophthalicicum JI]MDF9407483.1 NADPH-dependent glutamate synthase [Pelotomaculum isophthalicicum JI]OPX91996.1 MAG: Glutamate synthase (NADPH) small chain [Pelotomaculum sp. PtaB.Bin013]